MSGLLTSYHGEHDIDAELGHTERPGQSILTAEEGHQLDGKDLTTKPKH